MAWKVATFNVNGIRSRMAPVLEWLARHRPDALCLQELKCQNADFPLDAFRKAGYFAAFRGQKAFNGVAVLSRSEPSEVLLEFGDGKPDEEARLIAVKLNGIWIVNTYVPQGRSPEEPAFEYKLDFFGRLKSWLDGRFEPSQPLVWTGDINVAPEAIDLFDPKRLAGKVGFHPREHEALASVAAWGLVDVFRRLHPDTKQFTFWDYRLPQSFKRNLGWRLDHIYATRPLADACLECQADGEPRGRESPSDHTPVWAEFDLERLGAE
ncbi:MAG TPA: exodeoxyribonuclease III [Syntrophobacter fumaroxidans]|nr:exodeoxyribonuclease III [Syntrophobacter fumaroxidans]